MLINRNSIIKIIDNGLENIIIKKNSNGKYNLYALLKTECLVDNTETISLIGIKSEQLIYKKDFGFDMRLLSVDDYDYAMDSRGVKLLNFLKTTQTEILYNLRFSKIGDTLVVFQILNEGEKDMKYNIYEDLENYTIQVNVAGFNEDELDVVLEDGIITVKANPSEDIDVQDNKCIAKTFNKVKSECEIYLPKIESVIAELKDGILYLKVPKTSKGERIKIHKKLQ